LIGFKSHIEYLGNLTISNEKKMGEQLVCSLDWARNEMEGYLVQKEDSIIEWTYRFHPD